MYALMTKLVRPRYMCYYLAYSFLFSACSWTEMNSRSVKLQNIYPVDPRAAQEKRVLV